MNRQWPCWLGLKCSPGLKVQLGFALATCLCLTGLGTGCGQKEPETNEAPSAALQRDAYAAARVVVKQSVLAARQASISDWNGQPGKAAGVRPQADGTFKVWGWVEFPQAEGEPALETWSAVMSPLGEGRRWRALWLKVGEQQSGDPSAWEEDG